MIDIVNADAVTWAKAYAEKIARGEALPFHALLCDPPYHLTDVNGTGANGNFGHRSEAQKQARALGRGFMGKTWDGGDVSFRPETWSAFKEILHDGAFIMAFASARGWHRLACAIEDAGFVFHPSVFMFGWNYASGFPKASRIDTRIDAHGGKDISWFMAYVMRVCAQRGIKKKELTALFPSKNGKLTGWLYNKKTNQRLTVEQYNTLRDFLQLPFESLEAAEREIVGKGHSGLGSGETFAFRQMTEDATADMYDVTAPATDLAKVWAEHRYGRQALKPVLEPIIVAQKPYRGQSVDSIVRTGAGALNIGATRIGTEITVTRVSPVRFNGTHYANGNKYCPTFVGDYENPQGRWATNFILTHHPDCQHVGTPCVKSNGHHSYKIPDDGGLYRLGLKNLADKGNPYADAEGMETVEQWACVDECAVRLLDEQSGQRKSGWNDSDKSGATSFVTCDVVGGRHYSDSGGASRFFFNANWSAEVQERLTRESPVQYIAKASRAEKNGGLDSQAENNPHPTLKPLKLTTYLATLLLPPARYAPRRIFIPFAGSASECIGAMRAGWDEIVGVELTPEYIPIAKARIEYWQSQNATPTAPKHSKPVAASKRVKTNSKSARKTKRSRVPSESDKQQSALF